MTVEWSKDVRGILVRCAATLTLLLAAAAVPALAQERPDDAKLKAMAVE